MECPIHNKILHWNPLAKWWFKISGKKVTLSNENLNWALSLKFSLLFLALFLMIFQNCGAQFGTYIGAVYYIPCYICMDVSICIPPCNVLYMQNRQTWLIQKVPMNFLLLPHTFTQVWFQTIWILAKKSCIFKIFMF